MKPLILKIEGIRSFSDRVEIDFESISSGGLFGIFGSTGSGKSSILDSIILALYGKLNKREMVEIINTRKKSAFVSLSFEICQKGERKRYLVERNFKLKKDGSYGSATASLYRYEGENLIATASLTSEVNEKIEEILGLGQNEFTKCIILPQGEFSQFVKSTKTERVKIIEKLFSLERFGERFYAKLKQKQENLKLQLAEKTGELAPYLNDTKEALFDAKKQEEQVLKEYNSENEKHLKIKEYIEENQKFYNLHYQLIEDEKSLNELLEKKSSIDELKVFATLYEKAKTVDSEKKKLDEVYNLFKVCETRLEQAETDYKTALAEKTDAEKEYEKLGEYTERKNQAEIKKFQIENEKQAFEKRAILKKQIAENQASVNTIENKKIKAVQKIAELTEEREKVKEEIEILEKSLDLSKAFACVLVASLKREYSSQNEYYVNFKERLEPYNDGSQLYSFVSDETDGKIIEYEDKLNSVKESAGESVEESISRYEKASLELNKKKKILESLSSEIVTAQADIKVCESAKKTLVEKIKLDEKELEELNVKLSKIFDSADNFYLQLQLVENEIKRLNGIIETVKENYMIKREKESKSFEIYNGAKTEYESALKVLNYQKEILDKTYCEGVEDYQTAQKILSKGSSQNNMQEEIERFEKDLAYYTSSIEKAKRTLQKSKFSVEEYEEKLLLKVKTDENCKELNEKLIKYKNNTLKLSQNFEKRCIIEKDYNILYARAEVFARLEQVVKGRAFSEFISAEYLNEVSKEAKKTLLELTGGKYEIVYHGESDSDKDGFYIVDNLNGGIQRSVSSLSGGETFLVSLSLALALSARIYQGSDRPMEFFFLDEGFGTLDEDLVDTVLDSLEKLRNKNFSIGLISHLAEMKSRIDSKITVIPANEIKGSTVVIQNGN